MIKASWQVAFQKILCVPLFSLTSKQAAFNASIFQHGSEAFGSKFLSCFSLQTHTRIQNIICPESLSTMLECLCIEHGLFNRKQMSCAMFLSSYGSAWLVERHPPHPLPHSISKRKLQAKFSRPLSRRGNKVVIYSLAQLNRITYSSSTKSVQIGTVLAN